MKPFICILYAIMFYVIRAFLPSVPGRARHADPLINTLPESVGGHYYSPPCFPSMPQGPSTPRASMKPLYVDIVCEYVCM